MNTRRTTSESSDDLHGVIGAYALDALSEIERRQFEHHLERCSSCADELVGFRLTTSQLGEALPSESPPASLREQVLSAAQRTPQEAPKISRQRREKSESSALVRWLSVAAATLLVAASGLGVVAYQSSQELNEFETNAASVAAVLNAEDASVAKAEIEGGGTGSLVVSEERGEAVIVTTDLAAPPAGKAYQLWAINADGAESKGLLDAEDDSGGKLMAWPDDATAFGLTVEPAGGSSQPTTEPILLLEVPA